MDDAPIRSLTRELLAALRRDAVAIPGRAQPVAEKLCAELGIDPDEIPTSVTLGSRMEIP